MMLDFVAWLAALCPELCALAYRHTAGFGTNSSHRERDIWPSETEGQANQFPLESEHFMKTSEVKALVQEVLSGMPRRYSEHVIDEVFFAIEQNQDLLRRYETLSSTLGKHVVNNSVGSWVGKLLDKVGEREVASVRNTLIGAYSILDTDAKRLRNPTEAEARELLASYYQENRASLPPDIRQHRDFILELIEQGISAEEAFASAIAQRKKK